MGLRVPNFANCILQILLAPSEDQGNELGENSQGLDYRYVESRSIEVD